MDLDCFKNLLFNYFNDLEFITWFLGSHIPIMLCPLTFKSKFFYSFHQSAHKTLKEFGQRAIT